MKYVDEYREPARCRKLLDDIQQTATQCWTIMEVCGGQTHGLLRYGIEDELEGTVRLIHGPGCPVCVTSMDAIDSAIELATRPDVLVTSFGDMLRVPGSRKSLLQARADGGHVQTVYSPLDAVQLAQKDRDRQVVFFAVGFETTAPATALAVQQAAELGLDNFSLLVSHVRVLPAMEMLASSPHNSVQGFLAAGHVCAVTGYACYDAFAESFQVPVVVTGFEPFDLLSGILACVQLLEKGEAVVCNQYGRSVTREGNPSALEIVETVYEACDRDWRGIGGIAKGGLKLRERWRQFDALVRFPQSATSTAESHECRGGDVLIGRIRPTQCEHFGVRCTPNAPLGAPMVSSEGACAAYYRYTGNQEQTPPLEQTP